MLTNNEQTYTPYTRQHLLEAAEKAEADVPKPLLKNTAFPDAPTLPALLWAENENHSAASPLPHAPLSVTYFLLKTFAERKRTARVPEAAQMGKLFQKESLQNLCTELLNRWDCESKTKWILSFIATFGDDRFITPLRKLVDTFMDHKRGAMAADTVTAMAYIGSPKALQTVDRMARKIRHKQVKNAAQKAIQSAAQAQELSRDDLMDRIIPDFGFNQQGTLTLDYGPRQFTITLSPTLEPAITDNNGKTINNPPKPNKNDDTALAETAYNHLKMLKKELKEQVKMERERLEDNLSRARLWKRENWLNLYVKNPIMHIFAQSLIWGIYNRGKLIKAFRYMEDGTFNTADEDEFTIPHDALLGLVHPVELSKEEKNTWLEQLSDYQIVQPFNQLNRPVFHVPDDQKHLTYLSAFKGYMVNRATLKTKLLQNNWNRGSVQEGGMFYEYYKEFDSYNIGVQLNFLGDNVNRYGDDKKFKPVPIYDVVFYLAGTVKRGTYLNHKPAPQNTFQLNQIHPRFYSEIFLELKTIMHTGPGYNPKWRDEKN